MECWSPPTCTTSWSTVIPVCKTWFVHPPNECIFLYLFLLIPWILIEIGLATCTWSIIYLILLRMFTHLSESSRHDSVNFKPKNNENCYLYWRKSYCEIWCVVFMPPRSKIRGILFLSFCPPLWNVNLANNIWTMNARALIFHINIPCDKTFPWVPLFFTLWPWSLTHFFFKL